MVGSPSSTAQRQALPRSLRRQNPPRHPLIRLACPLVSREGRCRILVRLLAATMKEGEEGEEEGGGGGGGEGVRGGVHAQA